MAFRAQLWEERVASARRESAREEEAAGDLEERSRREGERAELAAMVAELEERRERVEEEAERLEEAGRRWRGRAERAEAEQAVTSADKTRLQVSGPGPASVKVDAKLKSRVAVRVGVPAAPEAPSQPAAHELALPDSEVPCRFASSLLASVSSSGCPIPPAVHRFSACFFIVPSLDHPLPLSSRALALAVCRSVLMLRCT